jgi:hypothetical protein
MSVFYLTLCDVRTSLLNAVGVRSIKGSESPDIEHILRSIETQLNNSGDFIKGIGTLSEEELLDLGFNFVNEADNFILFPVWLYPLIPDGTVLIDVEGNQVVKDMDAFEIHCNHWLSAGFRFFK